jgi:hypothetical protein
MWSSHLTRHPKLPKPHKPSNPTVPPPISALLNLHVDSDEGALTNFVTCMYVCGLLHFVQVLVIKLGVHSAETSGVGISIP